MRYFFVQLMFVVCMLIPISSFADVIITEVMYDAEGADTGKEWIEIYNNGNQSISIDDYYFYEADVHHGLDSGGETLSSGDYAVISQDLGGFNNHYDSNAIIIKSSFSLNNTGEELAISDLEKNIIYSLSYSSSFGASGNGNSLHYGTNGWFQSTPTPGSGPGNPIEYSDSSEDDSESNTGSNQSSSEKSPTVSRFTKEAQDYTEAFIDVSSPRMVHSTINFDAYIHRVKNGKTVKKRSGSYYLNLGDGTVFTSDEKIEYEHIYRHPGVYNVVFEYYRTELSRRAGEDPHAFKHIQIEVISNDIDVVGIDPLNNITIKNNSSELIDLYNWNLASNNKIFTFPQYSLIHSGQELIINSRVHNLGYIDPDDWALLRNEHNRTISSFSVNKSRAKKETTKTIKNNSVITTGNILPQDDLVVIPTLESSLLDNYLEQNPNKEIVSFDRSVEPKNNSKIDSVDNSRFPILAVVIAGFISLLLIILRFLLPFSHKKNPNQYEDDGVDIELIE